MGQTQRPRVLVDTPYLSTMQKQVPLFEENATETLEACISIFRDRGKGYTDTWRNGTWNAVKATRSVIGHRTFWTDEDYRTIVAAALVDVKIARLAGEYKEDTSLDLINYLANWVSQMKKIAPPKEDQGYPGDDQQPKQGFPEDGCMRITKL